MASRFELEVCVDRVDHAIDAARAGATRIEFNSALSLDGLTPSIAACRYLSQNCPIPVIAMLRPHADSFNYSLAEQQCLLQDCELLLDAGAAGIAFGALNTEGDLDIPLLEQVSGLCLNRELVLHRVFDAIGAPAEWLTKLADLGVRRILTSGGGRSALDGADRLRELQEAAEGRIEILPGAGVSSSNLESLIQSTGCTQVHGSFRLGGNAPSLEDIRSARQLLERRFGQ